MDETQKDFKKLDDMVDQIVQMEHDFVPKIRKQVAKQWLEDCMNKQNHRNEQNDRINHDYR